MRLDLIRATELDAPTILEMQRECFKMHFERYGDIETSPVYESIEKLLNKINYQNLFLNFFLDFHF